MLTAAAPAATTSDRPPLPRGFIAIYVLAQFGIWLSLLTPVVLTIALKVNTIATDAQKGAWLGIVLGAGAFVSLVSTPFWGALSDRTRSRFGRRRPWLLGGLVVGGIGLLLLGSATGLVMVGIGWVLVQAGFNAMQAAVMAIMPDIIPPRLQGRVSGFLGMTTSAATFVGVGLVSTVQGSSLLMFLLPFCFTVITVGALILVLPDRPLALVSSQNTTQAQPMLLRSMLRPFADRDFTWAFLSRFFIMMAWSFLLTYQFYLLTDHLALPKPRATSTLVTSQGIIAAATICVSAIGGWLSDWTGQRKPFVFASAAIEALGFLVIATAGSVPQFLVGVGIAAFGKGLYFGVDLALVAAILPDPDNTAKDLGIFQIANSLPQSLAPAIAPVLLLIGGGGNYPAVFLAGALCSAAGALAIVPVKRSR